MEEHGKPCCHAASLSPSRSFSPSRPDGCPPHPWSQTGPPPASRSSPSSLSLALASLPDRWPPNSTMGTAPLANSPGRANPLSCPSSHPWTTARPPRSSLNDDIVLTRPCSPRRGRHGVPGHSLNPSPRHCTHERGSLTWFTPPPRRHCPVLHPLRTRHRTPFLHPGPAPPRAPAQLSRAPLAL